MGADPAGLEADALPGYNPSGVCQETNGPSPGSATVNVVGVRPSSSQYWSNVGQNFLGAADILSLGIGPALRNAYPDPRDARIDYGSIQYRAGAVEGLAFSLFMGRGSVGPRGGNVGNAVVNGGRVGSAGNPANIPALRQQYMTGVSRLSEKATAMRGAGASSEEIARILHADRRALGVQFKDLTPAKRLAEIYARNLDRYGDKLGPSIEWLRNQGKSWEQIIESASRSGGKDLGF
jgi:hypothetical protein